ncbi:hypothetical protein ACWCXH_26625, partial [Kitasatospora sp. NPDC001660]
PYGATNGVVTSTVHGGVFGDDGAVGSFRVIGDQRYRWGRGLFVFCERARPARSGHPPGRGVFPDAGQWRRRAGQEAGTEPREGDDVRPGPRQS